jgi:hypothetical protein
MTQNGHLHEMTKKYTFVSWDWTLEVKMSQAYASFSCSKLTTHCTPYGCIIVIYFDEWGWGICLKNDATGSSISKRSEQMFLIFEKETHYQLSGWMLGEMILLA